MNLVMGEQLHPFIPQIADLVKSQIPHVKDFGPAECIAVVSRQSVLAAVIYNHYRHPDIEMSVVSSSPKW